MAIYPGFEKMKTTDFFNLVKLLCKEVVSVSNIDLKHWNHQTQILSWSGKKWNKNT